MQLCGLEIGKSEPGHHTDRHQGVSCSHHLLLCHKQLWEQGSALTLEQRGSPEREVEWDQIPARLLVLGQCFNLQSEMEHSFLVATLNDRGDFDQGLQHTHTSLDQRYLCLGEGLLRFSS